MRAATTSVDTHGPFHAPYREIKENRGSSPVYRGEVNSNDQLHVPVSPSSKNTLSLKATWVIAQIAPHVTKYTMTTTQ